MGPSVVRAARSARPLNACLRPHGHGTDAGRPASRHFSARAVLEDHGTQGPHLGGHELLEARGVVLLAEKRNGFEDAPDRPDEERGEVRDELCRFHGAPPAARPPPETALPKKAARRARRPPIVREAYPDDYTHP
jgi:hypothetical protein